MGGGGRSRRTGSNCSTSKRCRSPETDGGGTQSPTPGPCTTPQRQELWRARCGESRTPGSASGLGKRIGSNPDTAPQADSTGEVGGLSVALDEDALAG